MPPRVSKKEQKKDKKPVHRGCSSIFTQTVRLMRNNKNQKLKQFSAKDVIESMKESNIDA